MATPLGKNIVVAGGYSMSSGLERRVDVWDPSQKSWTALPPMPRKRALGAMVLVDDRLYCIGGIGEQNTALPEIDVFNVKTNEWAKPIINPQPASRLACVAIGDNIFIIGGIEEQSGGSADIHSSRVQVLNVRTGAWTPHAPLKTGRHGHAAAVFNGKIYVSGGYAETGENGTGQTASVEIYDPTEDHWRDGPPLLQPRAFHGMAAIENRLLVFGSRGDNRLSESLAADAIQWKRDAAQPLSRNRFAWAVIHHDIYVFDGEDETGNTAATIMRFDAQTSKWSVIAIVDHQEAEKP